jgi:hypothetical protein
MHRLLAFAAVAILASPPQDPKPPFEQTSKALGQRLMERGEVIALNRILIAVYDVANKCQEAAAATKMRERITGQTEGEVPTLRSLAAQAAVGADYFMTMANDLAAQVDRLEAANVAFRANPKAIPPRDDVARGVWVMVNEMVEKGRRWLRRVALCS